MYRVMLVDDEGIVTNSLSFLIEKNYEGQFEIETAKSGRAAIEVAERFRPDLIFMDIQMPGINGIEAMREIREFLPSAILIVLTAYDKFDYAKEAINLGVMEYLNKPFNQKMIVDVLDQAIAELDLRRERRRRELQTKEKLETVVPIIENGFIYSLIFHERFEEDIENYKSLLGLECDHGYMLGIVFGESQQDNHLTNNVGSSIKAQAYFNKVREILKNTFPEAIIGNVTSNKIPVFIPYNGDHMEYKERTEIIEKSRVAARAMRSASEDITYRIGIGGVVKLMDCLKSYDDALKALYSTKGSVAHVDDLQIAVSYEGSYPADLENAIFDSLNDGDEDQCLISAASFFDWMVDTYNDDMMSIRIKALEFVLRAESDMYRSGGGYTYRFESRKDYLAEILGADADSLKAWYMEKMRVAVSSINKGSTDHTHHLIKRAVEYIENNYSKDISLDDISKELNLSSYYFSKLFKDEKGENFVEFLTTTRVEKAKELMKDPDMSIKEISSICGYTDPNYFSRIFKKVTGYTPTEYKSKVEA